MVFALQPALAAGEIKIASFDAVKAAYNSSFITVLDRNHLFIDEIRTDFTKNQGDWLSINRVSPAVVRALIQSEDKNFYTHSGVDWLAVGSAAWTNITTNTRRGASTISMQLVGLLNKDLSLAGQRSYSDKIKQAKLALQLESSWSKSQILEAYLNLVPFKGELIGIDAVSKTIFNKHASGLNLKESSVIVAMLRSPNSNAYNLSNMACSILMNLASANSCNNLNIYILSKFNQINSIWSDKPKIARHFSRQVLKNFNYEQINHQHHTQASSGTSQKANHTFSTQTLNTGQIVTSLDARLQKIAINSIQQNLSLLLIDNVKDAAVVVLENKTGQVLAYVGSSGDISDASFVDHARSLRQAGSTLKPFLYGFAIDKKYITAASLIDNSELILKTTSGVYVPKNYDKIFTGWVSVRTALAASLNIPAVKVLTMVGTASFTNQLIDLGLELDKSSDFYGYSLALGSADISLLHLTNAYRALANQGQFSSYRYFKSKKTPIQKNVISPQASWIIADILSDRQSRVTTFGLDSPLSTSFWAAVKTGTSKDMRDNWTIGFSDKYTVGVWVGNSAGDSMRDVSGVTGAGPIWQDIINYLHQQYPSHQPQKPKGIVKETINFDQDIEPTRSEFFIQGTQTNNIVLAAKKRTKIITPTNGSFIALDADIPVSRQKIVLTAQGQNNHNYDWFVGDVFIGSGKTVLWLPSAGEHIIKLKNNDVEIDSVKVFIKGLMIN